MDPVAKLASFWDPARPCSSRAARANGEQLLMRFCSRPMPGSWARKPAGTNSSSDRLRPFAPARPSAARSDISSTPVRCPVGSDTGDWVSAVAMNARRALERRRFPFPALVERLRVPRKLGVTPLFQSMFVYQSLPRADRELLPLALSTGGARWNFGGGIAAETIAMPPFDAQFPLALTLGREGEGFSGRLQYDGRCVTTASARRIPRLP